VVGGMWYCLYNIRAGRWAGLYLYNIPSGLGSYNILICIIYYVVAGCGLLVIGLLVIGLLGLQDFLHYLHYVKEFLHNMVVVGFMCGCYWVYEIFLAYLQDFCKGLGGFLCGFCKCSCKILVSGVI
jgi:hypothetical protein